MRPILFIAENIQVKDVGIVVAEGVEIVDSVNVLRQFEVLLDILVHFIAIECVDHELRDALAHARVLLYHPIVETKVNRGYDREHDDYRAGDEQERQPN